MKNLIIVLFCLLSSNIFAQETKDNNLSTLNSEKEKQILIRQNADKEINSINGKIKNVQSDSLKKINEKIKSLLIEKAKFNEPEKSINSRISFVVGFGSSYTVDNVYQMPVVSTLDNKVKMEIGQRERLNATLGIVYTPYIYRIIDNEHPEGYLATKGLSFVGFFNPVSILKNSNLEDNFSLSNFGIGVGLKTVMGIGIYGVFEMYSIKQPKQWFIDEFKNGDKEYKVNNNIQSSFSSDDNNIFRNKLYPSIGIKVCYSFDIIRNFANSKTP